MTCWNTLCNLQVINNSLWNSLIFFRVSRNVGYWGRNLMKICSILLHSKDKTRCRYTTLFSLYLYLSSIKNKYEYDIKGLLIWWRTLWLLALLDLRSSTITNFKKELHISFVWKLIGKYFLKKKNVFKLFILKKFKEDIM